MHGAAAASVPTNPSLSTHLTVTDEKILNGLTRKMHTIHNACRSAFGRRWNDMARICATNCFAFDQQIRWNCATYSMCHFPPNFRMLSTFGEHFQ